MGLGRERHYVHCLRRFLCMLAEFRGLIEGANRKGRVPDLLRELQQRGCLLNEIVPTQHLNTRFLTRWEKHEIENVFRVRRKKLKKYPDLVRPDRGVRRTCHRVGPLGKPITDVLTAVAGRIFL